MTWLDMSPCGPWLRAAADSKPRALASAALRQRQQTGFTLVELITVMVVMGALGAIGVARFFNNSTFEAREYADQAKAIIRYGQKLAVAQNRPIYVSAGGSSFALCTASACAVGNLVPSPSGSNSGGTATKAQCQIAGSYVSNWMCEGKPASVSVSSNRASETGPGGLFFFDAMGRPYNAADAGNAYGSASSFTTALNLTFTGGGVSVPVVIEAETGYVH